MENSRNNTEKRTLWEVPSNLEKKILREHYWEWHVNLQICISKTQNTGNKQNHFRISTSLTDYELTGIAGIWVDKKQRHECGEGSLYVLWTTMPMSWSHSILVIQTLLLSVPPPCQVSRFLPQGLCSGSVSSASKVSSHPHVLQAFNKFVTFSLRLAFYSYPAPIECELHKGKGLLVCFIYCFMSFLQ